MPILDRRGAWRTRLAQGQTLVTLLMLFLVAGISASGAETSHRVSVYFFWGDGCPHCADAEPFLEALVARHAGANLRAYEVWYNEPNAALFEKMGEARGFETTAVPTIVVGNRHWIGYGSSMAGQIEAAVEACLRSGCEDAGVGVIPGMEGVASPPAPRPDAAEAEVIDLPLIGAVDLAGQSLWVSTVLISVVDGFNPCSLWVLSILVAMSLHTGSRRKVLIIGLVFITVTAGVYALFIAGLFTVLRVVSVVGWIELAVASIALFFGAVNIKDYFFYRQGLSFTIDERSKPGIFRRMRRVVDAGESIWGLIAATVVLAVGVSLVEFSCTAGFPVLWTNLLAAQEVTTLTFVLLLLLYLVIYQLDELAIFLVAVFTLKASRLEERQGRVLKLIGGILMLTLAAVMVVDPSLMDGLGSSLAIFGIAFAVAGLVLLVHRKLLPALGIRIGSDEPSRRGSS